MLNELDQSLVNIVSARNNAVERMMVETIEQLLGRVPTNQEVVEHGVRKIYPNGDESIYWDDTLLFKVTGLQFKTDDAGKLQCQYQIQRYPTP